MLPHNLLMNCLKNVSNLSVLSPFLFSCKNIFFSVRGGGGGGGQAYKWDLLFDLLLLFLKNALLSLLFHSKMSLTRKNPYFFLLAPLAWI